MYKQPETLKLTTPLGEDALLLERFTGREAISEPYRFRLEMLAEKGTDVPFARMLGAEVSISLARPDGPAREFHGIVHRLHRGGSRWSVPRGRGDIHPIRGRGGPPFVPARSEGAKPGVRVEKRFPRS